MPTLNRVEITNSLDVSLDTIKFLEDFCPQLGQMSDERLYYINAEVMEDLRRDAKTEKLTLPDLDKIEAIVKKEGLYEFIVGA